MLGLMESTVNAVKTYLVANLNTSVQLLNTERADTVVLDAIQGFYTTEQTEIAPDPFVMVIGESSRIVREQRGYFRGEHAIDLLIVCRDPDSDTVRTRLYRYVQALFECLYKDRLNQTIGQLFWGDPVADYSPVYVNASTSHFFMDAHMAIKIQRDENPSYT